MKNDSSIRPTLELFWRQHWGNFRETTESTSRYFRACRYHFELKWIHESAKSVPLLSFRRTEQTSQSAVSVTWSVSWSTMSAVLGGVSLTQQSPMMSSNWNTDRKQSEAERGSERACRLNTQRRECWFKERKETIMIMIMFKQSLLLDAVSYTHLTLPTSCCV